MSISKLDLIEKIMNFQGNSLSNEEVESLLKELNPKPLNSTTQEEVKAEPLKFSKQEEYFGGAENIEPNEVNTMEGLSNFKPMPSYLGEESATNGRLTDISDLLNPVGEIPFKELFHRKGSISSKELVENDPWVRLLLNCSKNIKQHFEDVDVEGIPNKIELRYMTPPPNSVCIGKDHEEYLACLQLGRGLYKNYLINRPRLLWASRSKSLLRRLTNFQSPKCLSLYIMSSVLENHGEIDFLKAMKEILKYNDCWIEEDSTFKSYERSIIRFISKKAPQRLEQFKIYNSCDASQLYTPKLNKSGKIERIKVKKLGNVVFKTTAGELSDNDGKYLIDVLYGKGSRERFVCDHLEHEITTIRYRIVKYNYSEKLFMHLRDRIQRVILDTTYASPDLYKFVEGKRCGLFSESFIQDINRTSDLESYINQIIEIVDEYLCYISTEE